MNHTDLTFGSRLASSLLILLATATVSAQGAVGIQPSAISLNAAPGATVSQQLRLDNPGTRPLHVTIYPGDWQDDGGGRTVYYPAGTLPQSSADWLTFSATEVELGPRSNATVTYTVQVPADAEPGTHWAVIFAEGADPASAAAGALTNFRVRTAHMVYVNIPPVELAGRITGIIGTPASTPTDPYHLQVNYLNEGNAFQVLTGAIEIRDFSGNLVYTMPVEQYLTLPGLTHALNVQLYGPLPAGEYLALVVLNYGDVTSDVAAEYVMTVAEDMAEPEFLFDRARDMVQGMEDE